MGVGEGRMEGVGRGIRLLPRHGVDDPKTQPLQREAYREDDVVRARHPQRTIGLEDAPGLAQPPDVELMVFSEASRSNRVTTPALALPSAVGRWCPRTRSPEVEVGRRCKPRLSNPCLRNLRVGEFSELRLRARAYSAL